MLKTTNAEFSFIEIWLTDRNNRLLEIELEQSNINESKYRKYVQSYGLLPFARIWR